MKDQLIKMTNEKEAKSKFFIDETLKAYEVGYIELQDINRGLRRSVSARKSIDEILTISKYINDYLKHPQMSTNKDLIGQISKYIYD